MQNSITKGQIPNTSNLPQVSVQQPVPQPCYATPPQTQVPVQQIPAANPNYAGVNIQIFNPMVGTPSGTIYPQQTGSAYDAGVQGGCYPSNYYTGQYPQGTFVPQNPYGQPHAPQGGQNVNGGYYDANGVYYPPNPNGYPVPGTPAQNGQGGYYDANGVFHPAPQGGSSAGQNGGTPVDAQGGAGGANTKTGADSKSGTDAADSKTDEATAQGKATADPAADGAGANGGAGADGKSGGADGQGKTGTDSAGGNGDANGKTGTGDVQGKDEVNKETSQTDTKNTESETKDKESKPAENDSKTGKTEKRKIVELSDDYIKTLENYLNSQDSEVRLMGAKEVVNRLTEDDSRKDDPALTALVNKMLQDPSSAIRAIALSLVDSRTILGDDYTVNVLKKMQTSKDGFGQDSVQATSALLKMAGKTVEKEFEVKETPKKDKK